MANEYLNLVFSLFAVSSAFSLCFTNRVIWMALEYLVLGMSVSSILVANGYEYLALMCFFSTITTAILVYGYSIVILGGLLEKFSEVAGSSKVFFLNIIGLIISLVLALGLYKLLIDQFNISDSTVISELKVGSLGEALMGRHFITLQLIALGCFVCVVGFGRVLARKDSAT